MFWHVCYGVRGRVVTFENCAIPGQQLQAAVTINPLPLCARARALVILKQLHTKRALLGLSGNPFFLLFFINGELWKWVVMGYTGLLWFHYGAAPFMETENILMNYHLVIS